MIGAMSMLTIGLTALAITLGLPAPSAAAPVENAAGTDPCAVIAGQTFVVPADAMACLTSFPFNETLRQNVLDVVSKVFDFYTFEDYYLAPVPEFGQPAVNIRAELARINGTTYDSDYAFNKDLYDMVNSLNDGHTGWYPYCYWDTFQNLLPAPVVSLEVDGVSSVYVVPDLVDFLSLIGTDYTSYFDNIEFDYARLAGAQVLEINGMDAYDYADYIADTVTGNYIDHGVRVNSVFSSYRISDNALSQRFGDIAGPIFPEQDNLTMTLIPVNATESETVVIPFLAVYTGEPFTDSASYWGLNCAANNETNGVDYSSVGVFTSSGSLHPRAVLAKSSSDGVGLPSQFVPNLPMVSGSEGVIKNYILDDNITGVMFVGSFDPDNYYDFQYDVSNATADLLAAGVSRLIIDLTNNGGGYVCLGEFLHQYLAGDSFGFPGYSTAIRANMLAQKIVAADIALDVPDEEVFYPPDNWAFTNDTVMPDTYNYITPDVTKTINNVTYAESQRFYDVCTPFNVTIPKNPPFDLNNVVIVSNADCASTCAQFSTLMYERHNTTIAVFGGKPGETMQFKGMAGEQVLEWYDIDSEIKTAQLQDDPLAPPDLLVSADFRHNWRTAYSWRDEEIPIAYYSELPQYRFPYTMDTYMNPQNLWSFAASQLFS
ncbi:uncharacterized protein LAESUDRAFT_78851 [Laetiporus sulphureus 93-53]|uniref:Tail specific protease domain-containing protein n=1 Tax=Laetiporus sulphureus 93-53 TaxID=1314785 RepID=A0A165F1G1_9APHY|nr:uncharacterized protein LAESUDRAFT_78851 [Laetiporus sulphureus 93-53]KZT08170.1 hypothetical protein LAESUDRAFT_78851 [Laetiporus sulphureus 93-53]